MRATVARVVRFEGVGLHSGKRCRLAVKPAKSGGIQFRVGGSDDGECRRGVLADFKHVDRSQPLCTVLRDPSGGAVRTVEHLMAAIWACGISECEISVNSDGQGGELPILDGSSQQFCEKLACQVEPLNEEQEHSRLPVIRVLRPVEVFDKEKQSFATFSPMEEGDSPSLECAIELDDFDGRIPPAKARYVHKFGCPASLQTFRTEVAPARTFTFEEEIAFLHQNNLALGGSLDNAVVFSGDGSTNALNKGGLLFDNEWARHKILDCIGDLALSLSPFGILHANFSSFRPGHSTTNKLLHALFSDPRNFSVE